MFPPTDTTAMMLLGEEVRRKAEADRRIGELKARVEYLERGLDYIADLTDEPAVLRVIDDLKANRWVNFGELKN